MTDARPVCKPQTLAKKIVQSVMKYEKVAELFQGELAVIRKNIRSEKRRKALGLKSKKRRKNLQLEGLETRHMLTASLTISAVHVLSLIHI